MRKTSLLFFVLAISCASAIGWAAGRQTPQTAAKPTIDDVLKSLRADLQMNRSDLIAKNVTLSSDQAAKFWPVFSKYQEEQNVIMDEQLKGIQQYVDKYETMDDATALGLIKGHFERDARMTALRQRWLPQFQEVLPTKLAARVLQIDRRISLAHQVEIATRIPLIH